MIYVNYDAVKNFAVKKVVYNAKIKDIENEIPNTKLATNTTLNAKKNKVKNEIPCITNLAATAALNAKINKVKNKIPDITNLATTTALTAVENKLPGHSKCITTPEFNELIAEKFAARLAQANLPSKNNIANFVKKTEFDDKLKNLNKTITSNKTKHVRIKNELNELSKKIEAISTKGF